MDIKKKLVCITAVLLLVFSGCKRYLEETTPPGNSLPEIKINK